MALLRKQKRFISGIIILCLLFSGLFYDCLREESSMEKSIYQNITGSPSDAILTEQDAALTEITVCTLQMLGIRTTSCIQQVISRTFQNDTVRLASNYLYLCIVLYLFLRFYSTVCTVPFLKSYGQTVLVSYIHNQDGKKQTNIF